jgi:hypothetical protein
MSAIKSYSSTLFVALIAETVTALTLLPAEEEHNQVGSMNSKG